MRFSETKSRVKEILALTLLFAAALFSPAQETVYTNLDCAITFPAHWWHIPIHETNYVALVKTPEGDRSIALRVLPGRFKAVDYYFHKRRLGRFLFRMAECFYLTK